LAHWLGSTAEAQASRLRCGGANNALPLTAVLALTQRGERERERELTNTFANPVAIASKRRG